MKRLSWKVWNVFQSLKNREEGQGMVEYALLVALIAVVVIAALIFLGPQIAKIFTSVNSTIGNATA